MCLHIPFQGFFRVKIEHYCESERRSLIKYCQIGALAIAWMRSLAVAHQNLSGAQITLIDKVVKMSDSIVSAFPYGRTYLCYLGTTFEGLIIEK